MFRIIVSLLIFASLSIVSVSQPATKNYNLLFKKECNFPDAALKVFHKYADVVGNENAMNLKMHDVQFNYGKVVIYLDDLPTELQIAEMLTSENLVSYELILTKKMYRNLNEINKIYKKSNIARAKDYQLIMKYYYEAKPVDEIKLLTEVFGVNEYLFEKDANEMGISIPDYKADIFIQKLKENDDIVFVQEL